METANNCLDNAVKSIETNHDLIQQLSININSTVATATAQQDWLLTVALDQSKFHLIIQNEYQQLYTGYTNLLQGKLSPIVISHTELLKTIRHIHSLLFIHRPGYNLLHNAPTYFYHNAEFKLHKSNRSIFILVKFPVGPNDQPMKLFKNSSLSCPSYQFKLACNNNYSSSIISTNLSSQRQLYNSS